ncbi:MAG: hypothetical protein FWD86_03385, partial [Firmicutes bacterium]|nr:hypothetical protein [Bacillota bacterium]
MKAISLKANKQINDTAKDNCLADDFLILNKKCSDKGDGRCEVLLCQEDNNTLECCDSFMAESKAEALLAIKSGGEGEEENSDYSSEQTFNLIRQAKMGDSAATTTLLIQNSPLIKSVIRYYKNKGVEYDDLYQLGCVGFLKAIKNFCFDFGVRFSTYAVPMIAGEVKRFLRDDGLIKVSRATKSLGQKINAFVEKAKTDSGESPSISEIAKHFNATAY